MRGGGDGGDGGETGRSLDRAESIFSVVKDRVGPR